MRLIDADAAQKIADEELSVEDAGTVQYVLSHAPTVEAEPARHGTWETSFAYDWDGNKLYIHFHRECGFEYRNYLEDEHPYCPHCGVKMEGGGSDGKND